MPIEIMRSQYDPTEDAVKQRAAELEAALADPKNADVTPESVTAELEAIREDLRGEPVETFAVVRLTKTVVVSNTVAATLRRRLASGHNEDAVWSEALSAAKSTSATKRAAATAADVVPTHDPS